MNYIGMIGKSFANLTILDTEKKNNRIYYRCLCSCGNKTLVRADDINKRKSCGCARHKDLVGQKFNNLTVLKHLGNGIWECECTCGNITKVTTNKLLNNKIKSCGCLKNQHKDLIGQRFGHLTVKKYVGHGKWECLCDCQNTIYVQTNSLTNKSTTSCGCAPYKDLTGRKFGRLTATKYLGNSDWLCKCSCGKETKAKTSQLLRGTRKSCGCLWYEHDDLTGKTFGKLTVIEMVDKTSKNDRLWLCKCTCGKTCVVSGNHLKTGHTQSCGCITNENLVGQRFGKLTVVAEQGRNSRQHRLWLCKCDCGHKVVIETSKLKNGHTKSCGCVKESFGEIFVNEILTESEVVYEAEKPFRGLKSKNGKNLKFDFWIPGQNLLIEYNGEQHYESIDYFGGEKKFKRQRENDKLKLDYCKKKGINLLVIPYKYNTKTKIRNFLIEKGVIS